MQSADYSPESIAPRRPEADTPAGRGATGLSTKAPGAIPERADIDDAFKWNMGDIFESTEAWEKAYGEAETALGHVESFKGTLGKSAENLLACYRFQDEISEKIEHLFAFASLNRDTDTRVTAYQDMYNRIYSLAVRFSAAAAFFTPELLSIPEETVRGFIAANNDLEVYEHAIEDTLRMRPHVLSESEESLIAKAGNVFRGPSDAFNMLTDADIVFPTIKDEDGNEVATSNALYYKYRGSRVRSVRRENEEAFHGTYRKYRNTLASLMRSNVAKAQFNAEVRGYESTLHAALDASNIPVPVYHNLIRSVNDNLAPLHRYAALRKKILGLDELRGYDLYNTLFPDADMTITFDETKELLVRGLEPLGGEYVDAMMGGIDAGWIDIYENEGKRSGAYSAGIYGIHPYVLLNYHDRLEDAFTAAHELGHSMHSFFSQKRQPKIYADYTIFNAEVASTTNEALLVKHLLDVTKDRDERLFLINFYIDSIRGTFYRQTLFAEFELDIHTRAARGESLTADLFDEVYGSLMEKYYGAAFRLDEYKAAEWSRVPHFYRNFYVYTYATGYSAATAFAKRILEQGDGARGMYIASFLSGGSSDYSTALLEKAGVDMTSPEPVAAVSELFDELLDELEALMTT